MCRHSTHLESLSPLMDASIIQPDLPAAGLLNPQASRTPELRSPFISGDWFPDRLFSQTNYRIILCQATQLTSPALPASGASPPASQYSRRLGNQPFRAGGKQSLAPLPLAHTPRQPLGRVAKMMTLNPGAGILQITSFWPLNPRIKRGLYHLPRYRGVRPTST